jgi:glucose-6-phosphate isomerase
MSNLATWQRFQEQYSAYPALGLALDLSRVDLPAGYFDQPNPLLNRAFDEMARIEKGERVNTTHDWMVGHYWLRKPELAPTPELRAAIRETLDAVKRFAAEVHSGSVQGQRGSFQNLLVIGIGGSALGPQFVAKALGHPHRDRLTPFFFDNTDPDGMDKVLAELARTAPATGEAPAGKDSLATALGRTLCLVISKSGTTPETANGMLEAAAAYRAAGLDFARHAVAITMVGSKLHGLATKPAAPWLGVFPMWDWVGGRTSETSAVGLLPALLQGLDIDALLEGACACDELTRVPDPKTNPAARLALAWHFLTGGRGQKDMVVLPYKDRLELFARYLQQLVMESLGKEKDRAGQVVHQGITVYGNKGSTDQHAYVQQLRDGVLNFFVVFLEVLRDRDPAAQRVEVEAGVTSGDYLSGLFQGTRRALYEKGRQSITLTLDEITPHRIGVLIALFERTVGLYAGLVNINAYDQPGVEAGKKAAASVLALQRRVVAYLAGVQAARDQRTLTAETIAADLDRDAAADPETVFKICEHLAANPGSGVQRVSGTAPATAIYGPATPGVSP